MKLANLFAFNSQEYAAIAKDEEGEENLLPQDLHLLHHPQASRTGVFASHALTFLIAALLSTFMLSTIHQLSSSRPISEPTTTKHLHCGNSTAEARARGCIFDVLTNM